LITQAANT